MTTTDRIPPLRSGEESKLLAKLGEHPDRLSLYRRLARLLARRGEFTGAVTVLNRARRRDRRDRETRLVLAQVLEKAGRLEEAARILRGLIKSFPDKFNAYERLGRVYKAQGRKLLIARYLKGIAGDNPIRARALKLLVRLYKEEGKFREALDQLDSLIAEDGEDFSRLKDRARFLDRLGRAREATAAYRKAIRANPQNPDMRLLLGILLRKSGKRREARAVFADLCSIKHGFYGGHIQLAEMDVEDGNAKEAQQHLKLLDARWPGNSRVSLNRARLDLDRGQPETALKTALEAARLTPFYYTDELALGYRIIADSHTALGQDDQGRIFRLLADEVSRGGDFFSLLAGLAEKLLKQGRLDLAGEALEEMLERFPDNSLALALKAEVLLARDDVAGAKRCAAAAAGESDPRYRRDRLRGLALLREISRREGRRDEEQRLLRQMAELEKNAD